jgi:hypothetical protein
MKNEGEADDEELPQLDADVERQQRDRQMLLRQADFLQRSGKTQSVDQPEVREPLLRVLRISPDYRPAPDPLRMATALSERDPAAARALLAELASVQPLITAAK